MHLWIIQRVIIVWLWARGTVLPDLGAASMRAACSWAMRPSGRSSVSRRPCVGSEGGLRSLSHCCRQTGSSSCLPHCYERRQQRHRHPINDSRIILHEHSFSNVYQCRHTHIIESTNTHTSWFIQPSHKQTHWNDDKWSVWTLNKTDSKHVPDTGSIPMYKGKRLLCRMTKNSSHTNSHSWARGMLVFHFLEEKLLLLVKKKTLLRSMGNWLMSCSRFNTRFKV